VADLVPEGELGDFWARRQLTSQSIRLALPLLAGLAVTWWKQSHVGLAAEIPIFQWIFLLGAVMGLGSWVSFILAPEPPFHPDPNQTSFFASLRRAFGDREYRPLIMYCGLFAFSGGLAMGVGSAYLVQVLNVSAGWVSAFASFGMLCGLYSMRFWGRLLDKFGCRPVLLVATAGMGLWSMCWVFVQPDTWWLAGPIYLLFIFQSAIQAGRMTLASKLAPVAGRPAYLAAQSAISHLGFAVAPLLGAGLAYLLEGFSLTIGSVELTNLHVVLFLAGLLRLLSIPLLMRVREPRVRTVGRVMKVLRNHAAFRPGRSFYEFMFFWLAPIIAASREVARGAGKLSQNVQGRIDGLRAADDEFDEESGGDP